MNTWFSPVKYTCYLLLVFSFTLKTGDESIPWSEKPLRWDDFRGKPHPRSNVSALTYSGIKYNFEQNGNRLTMKVVATFDPEHSWVNNDLATEYVLRHEQLHFDISELHARKLRAALKQISPTTSRPNSDAEKLYDKFTKESRKYQDRYDAETGHSGNEINQAAWDKKITMELNEMKAEEDTVVLLIVRGPSRN